jgi:hypothetical protein
VTVIDEAHVFFGFTTTDRPSYPIGSSMISIPAARHASASVDLMGREAFAISISPRQNFWKPPPVPDVPTVTRAPRLAR